MNDDKDQLDELPDSLRGIVSGIVAESVPDDLKKSARTRLDDRFKPRPSRARKPYAIAVVATSMIAAIVAAVVFRLPSPTDSSVGTGEAIPIVAREDVAAIRRPSIEGPSLWAYHRAANGSLDQLDGLLAKHAASVLTSGHSITRSTDPYITSRFLEE